MYSIVLWRKRFELYPALKESALTLSSQLAAIFARHESWTKPDTRDPEGPVQIRHLEFLWGLCKKHRSYLTSPLTLSRATSALNI